MVAKVKSFERTNQKPDAPAQVRQSLPAPQPSGALAGWASAPVQQSAGNLAVQRLLNQKFIKAGPSIGQLGDLQETGSGRVLDQGPLSSGAASIQDKCDAGSAQT